MAAGLVEGEDPILSAHTQLSMYRREREVVLEPPPPRKRYLLPSKVMKQHLTEFDYSLFDSVPIPSAPSVKERQRYIETVLDDSDSRNPVIMRALESKVSARVAKGFITLSAEPASAVGEFDPEKGRGGVIDDLDEKLTRFKEVEELYDAIMKTIKGSHLDADQ
ncbi:hypothetical protein HK097_006732, partial [Rhizophlyctis rosea]